MDQRDAIENGYSTRVLTACAEHRSGREGRVDVAGHRPRVPVDLPTTSNAVSLQLQQGPSNCAYSCSSRDPPTVHLQSDQHHLRSGSRVLAVGVTCHAQFWAALQSASVASGSQVDAVRTS